jgi:hypothetical protein
MVIESGNMQYRKEGVQCVLDRWLANAAPLDTGGAS